MNIIADAKRDYYEVLGVNRDANEKAIKDAFRTLALRFHPDRNKEPGAEDRFKEISEAYAVLSDPKKRAEYDNRGFAGVSGFSQEDLFGGINFDDIFGGVDMGLGGGLFDQFFRRHRAGPRKGADIEIDVVIPLDKVAKGGEENVRYSRLASCDACRGSGAERGTQPAQCPSCGGTGRVAHSQREGKGNVFIQEISTCPVCHGHGVIIEKPCHKCGGSGWVEQVETLAVTIPVGVEEGMALKVAGRGRPSPEAGGIPGDLYVVVNSAPDARFTRAGADLWRTEVISVTDAVLGTTLTVPTLEAHASVTVEAGSQPDTVLRLRGKGLPVFRGRGHGDLYLRLRVHVPERLTAKERELYRQLHSFERNE